MEKNQVVSAVFGTVAVAIIAFNNLTNLFYSRTLPTVLIAGIIYGTSNLPYRKIILQTTSGLVTLSTLLLLGVGYAFRDPLKLPLTATITGLISFTAALKKEETGK